MGADNTAAYLPDTFFVTQGELANEALHFHELIHVVQWRLLGPERFIALYAEGLERFGYRSSPLEVIAYDLEDHSGLRRRCLTPKPRSGPARGLGAAAGPAGPAIAGEASVPAALPAAVGLPWRRRSPEGSAGAQGIAGRDQDVEHLLCLILAVPVGMFDRQITARFRSGFAP